MKSLVIYYSLEGNTKLIADTIKNELNSDVLELRTKKQYPIERTKIARVMVQLFKSVDGLDITHKPIDMLIRFQQNLSNSRSPASAADDRNPWI